MFIHFGWKTTRKKLGRVADYCLICHSRRSFQLVRSARSFHLYLIPVGKPEVLGHQRVCDVCGQRYSADPKSYVSISKGKADDLELLIRETNPGLSAGLAAEAALNRRLQNKQLPIGDRSGMIAGPFHAVYPLIRERALTTHLDRWSGPSVVATVVLPLLILALGVGNPPSELALYVGGGLLVTSLALLVTDVPRYVRRVVNPRLLQALAPFDVTLEELQTLAADDPIVGKVARRVGLARLHRILRPEPAVCADDPAET